MLYFAERETIKICRQPFLFMNTVEHNPFLHTIFQLRREGDLVLYDNFQLPTDEECLIAGDLLEEEYELEKVAYPFTAPPFDLPAALWGAKTLYTFAQLVLYRKHEEAAIPGLFTAYTGAITPDAIVSADLCLRFLPQLYQQVSKIDDTDIILSLMQEVLNQWHYSGIGRLTAADEKQLQVIKSNACLQQLYADRIISRKDKTLATHPHWQLIVKGCLGIYKDSYWKELTFIDLNTNDE